MAGPARAAPDGGHAPQDGDHPLRTWLRAGDWASLRAHFERHAPASAAEHEARALTTMALMPGPVGARHALADLRRACSLDPHNVLQAANLMQALIDAGEISDALRLTEDAMRQAPHLLPLAEKRAWALLAAARWDEAAVAARHALAVADGLGLPGSDALRGLESELAIGWWRPLCLGGVELRQPRTGDEAFIARCFRDVAFMSRYRRIQEGHDDAVRAHVGLARQRPRSSGRIDWIVCRDARPLGLAGIADIDFLHGRGELLVGLAETDPRPASALKASLAVMDFAFTRLGLRKLVSYVYGDNPEAQANTLHLGLRQEGVLRRHLLTAQGPIDLYVNGMLADEYRDDRRLQRLLARWRGS